MGQMKKIIRVREERCTGCRVCKMVCSLEKEGSFNPRRSRIKVFQNRGEGLDIISICQQCEPAPCEKRTKRCNDMSWL